MAGLMQPVSLLNLVAARAELMDLCNPFDGAMLFVRTLTDLMAKGPGFATTSLISFGLDPLRNGYKPAESGTLLRRIYEEVQSSPSAQAAALARFPLLTGGSWNRAAGEPFGT